MESACLCWVAAGRHDAYYEDDLRRWDWAAAGFVAEQAGAEVALLAGLPAT
jgi:myo-inositol-1(or 4)-monophosphatase